MLQQPNFNDTEKIPINVVFLGNVDSGKSTLVGNLLWISGSFESNPFKKIEKESIELGRSSFKYAWIVDKLIGERERGLTIQISNAKLCTNKHYFTLINVPGHRDFIRSTITGISQGDCAVLVISAPKGEYEHGIDENIGGQVKQQAIIAYTLGIRQLIVCINKMDDFHVNYSETRYNFIVNEIKVLLNKIGYQNIDTIPFIPISAWYGDNLINRKSNNQNLSWYRGVTILEALGNLKDPVRLIDKPLRIPLYNRVRIGGIGTVLLGKIEYGILQAGLSAIISPGFITTEVKSIEKHLLYGQTKYYPGDIVGFNVMNVAIREIFKGHVVGNAKDNPPSKSSSFKAQIIIIKHQNISKGYSPMLNIHCLNVRCIFSEIIDIIDKKTGNPILNEKNEELTLKSGDSAIVAIKTFQPISIEAHSEFPSLGRFIMRDNGQIVAVGIVKSVEQIKYRPISYH